MQNPNLDHETKNKYLKKLNYNDTLKIRKFDEPCLVMTSDRHFGNKIDKVRLCVAYKQDNLKRVIVHRLKENKSDCVYFDKI